MIQGILAYYMTSLIAAYRSALRRRGTSSTKSRFLASSLSPHPTSPTLEHRCVVMSEPALFTLTSVYSLLGVLAILAVAQYSSRLLPSSSSKVNRFTWVWLSFDALIHFIFEGSFLALSFPAPRTANAADNVFGALWREYARADTRWGTADTTVVSLELLTVLGCGPLCVYILYLMVKNDRAKHFWLVVLS